MRPRRSIGCLLATALVAAAGAGLLAGCGGSSPGERSGYARYHEPSQGWTADVPAGWTSVVLGPQFVRGQPLSDPTRLIIRTYRHRRPAAALRALAAGEGIATTAREDERAGGSLSWRRYRGNQPGRPGIAVDIALASDGEDTHVLALVTRRAELAGLVRTALLPALDSFVPGPPDRSRSVLAGAPADPPHWPTRGWRTAAPASEGVDGARLEAMLAEIRAARLPVDSVTVVRHGNVVLDSSFGRFAAGRLGAPFASGRRHELQSATKSVTSAVLGIVLGRRSAPAAGVRTPLVRVAAAVHYTPEHADARKRAMTLEDLLTMQSGLEWRESGRAYERGSGNDVVAMLATRNWTEYVIDRPMAARPGTTFVYNTGAAHLVSAAVTVLTRGPAATIAARTLFAPLGIRSERWPSDPQGVSLGGFGLGLEPRDLAKLALLYLHHGRWDGRQVVPESWIERSTTDHVADPLYEYGYLWWLDRADGYAYMAGLYGQLAAVVPGKDLVVVVTGHFPGNVDATAVTRWLLERYVLPAAH
jgi:CubicO group peptidase (beta-lactamase class C family)